MYARLFAERISNSYEELGMPNLYLPVAAAVLSLVILTANAIEGMKGNYLDKGFDDYLAKPIEKTELRRVLGKYLG